MDRLEDTQNPYGEMNPIHDPLAKREFKAVWFDFFKDFRDFLAEYYRETVFELCIGELPIKGEIKLFDGLTQGKVCIKNQGQVSCYLSTLKQGGYRLDPGETKEFFVNTPVTATTLSGTTVLGFIRT